MLLRDIFYQMVKDGAQRDAGIDRSIIPEMVTTKLGIIQCSSAKAGDKENNLER